jgi:LuxR family transcriptional regulator, maltose regulon positive regulatory protein
MVGEVTALETSRVGRRIIERPRLTRLLSESESRVMLLVAPAGYGKTTLARQWLQDQRHAWYQATPASSDVAALALGLAEAGSDVLPDVGERIRGRLKTVSDAASEASSLAADLAGDFSAWPAGARLVIDDYHLVAENPAAEAFVEAFTRATAIPILVTSRTRPSWVSAKNLLYGEVVEFGRNVLAMTHDEAAEALAQSHDEIPGLVALAEGWPAVIGLAALVPHPLQGTSDVPETLHEYFADELFLAIDDRAQWHVAALSIPTDIDEAIAKALFGAEGASVAEEAYACGFLTKNIGGYEMHPLVRQFLRIKLRDFDSSEVREAAVKIAHGYADARKWDEAASVAIEFGLADALIRVMSEALDAILSEGRLATLERWLAAARKMAPASSAVQMAALEVDFRTGDWSAAAAKANQLARTIARADAFASRVYLRAGQMAHLDDRQQDALAMFDAAKAEARTPLDLRNALWSTFLTLCDLEKRDEAQAALQAVEELPPRTSDDLLRANHGRLQFAIRWGPLVETLDSVAGCVDLVEQSADPLVRTGFLQSYGSALGLVARYDDALGVADWQLQEAERYRLEWVIPHALEMRAIALTGRREFDSALKSLARARRLAAEQGNVHTQVNELALTARVHLSCGAAERAADVLDNRSIGFTSPGMEGDFLATHALVLACCGRNDEARLLIERSEAVSSHLDAAALRDFARVIVDYSERGHLKMSLRAAALETTRRSGNYDAFVCAYRAFPLLLEDLRDGGVDDSESFTDLICQLDAKLAERVGLRAPAHARRSSGTLTPRENEIFGFIKQGRSNREIAKALWISESTVKVHVHHVLEKLDVKSRAEAAAVNLDG